MTIPQAFDRLIPAVRRWIAASLVVGISLGLTGCPAKKPETGKTVAKNEDGEAGGQRSTTAEILGSALHQMRPENLGIDADAATAISLLNTWEAAEREGKDLPPAQPGEWAKKIWTGASLDQVNRQAFAAQDGEHIRDCIFLDEICQHAGEGAKDDQDRVTRVFNFVTRNLALYGDNDTVIPAGPFRTMLFGQGRPADRAVLFVELLRQLRIDALVLTSPEDGAVDEGLWLVAVIVDGKLHLYDCVLGLPIPNDAKQAGNSLATAATLTEAVDKPELLASLATRADQPFRIDADSLKTFQPRLVSSPAFDSDRMRRLQANLPGEYRGIVYDPLDKKSEEQVGRINRIRPALAAEMVDKLALWSYLPRLREEMRNRTEDSAVAEAVITEAMRSPYELAIDPQTRAAQVTGFSRRQLRARLLQLEGNYTDAVGTYVTIRQLSTAQIPIPAVQRAHDIAAEDALYWSGVCKAELGDPVSAADLLGSYLQRYRRGRWRAAARQLLAQSQAQANDVPAALKTLSTAVPDETYRNVGILLARYLGQAAPAAASE